MKQYITGLSVFIAVIFITNYAIATTWNYTVKKDESCNLYLAFDDVGLTIKRKICVVDENDLRDTWELSYAEHGQSPVAKLLGVYLEVTDGTAESTKAKSFALSSSKHADSIDFFHHPHSQMSGVKLTLDPNEGNIIVSGGTEKLILVFQRKEDLGSGVATQFFFDLTSARQELSKVLFPDKSDLETRQHKLKEDKYLTNFRLPYYDCRVPDVLSDDASEYEVDQSNRDKSDFYECINNHLDEMRSSIYEIIPKLGGRVLPDKSYYYPSCETCKNKIKQLFSKRDEHDKYRANPPAMLGRVAKAML